MKAFDLVSLAAEKLHSVFDIRRQIAAAYKMGRHRPATFGFDINLLRPQCVQSFSKPELTGSVSFDSLEDGRRCLVLRRLVSMRAPIISGRSI